MIVFTTSRSLTDVFLCLCSALTLQRLLQRSLVVVLVAGLATNSVAPSHADIVMSGSGHFRQIIAQVHQEANVEQTTLTGAFDDSVSANSGPPNVTSNANASQLSQTPILIGETITGNGSAAFAADVPEPFGFVTLRSDSFFEARFTVDATEEYVLSSFVEWNGTLPPAGNVPELNRSIVTLQQDFPPLQLVEDLRDSTNQGISTADNQFLLEQGRNYTLRIRSETLGANNTFVAPGSYSAIANWEFHLAPVPELGDVNLDGMVNLLDVSPFIDLILAGDYQVEADINLDSAVNLLDIGPFVELLNGL